MIEKGVEERDLSWRQANRIEERLKEIDLILKAAANVAIRGKVDGEKAGSTRCGCRCEDRFANVVDLIGSYRDLLVKLTRSLYPSREESAARNAADGAINPS
ncbi:MAG: hypothetical protein AB1346_02870 [Thermodesulfobacteriota bacterium]